MKKNTFFEILVISLLTISCSLSIYGKTIELDIRLDMRAELANVKDKNTIGIRGNTNPLSWKKTYLLSDNDGDGIYTGTIVVKSTDKKLEFKFIHSETIWELSSEGNRIFDLSNMNLPLQLFTWDEITPLSIEEIAAQTIPSEQLLEDFEIVKSAYTIMHPGLYRYNTPETINQHLLDLKENLSKDLTIPEAYIAFSRFLAQIKCGHTYANFWNQPTIVKRAITFQPDKIPFHFRIIEKRMIISESAIPELKRGLEVTAINGKPWQEILAELLPLIGADGTNVGQQLVNLQLLGISKFEAFDMCFPILFPPHNNKYTLDLMNINTQKKETIIVSAMSRKERIKVIKAKFPEAIPTSEKELWQFKIIDKQTALLTLHTFSTWNFKMDWKAFIKNAFTILEEQNIPNLIIDIRYNSGGNDAVGLELFKHIAKHPISIPARKDLYRFTQFPENVKPHIGTWDNWFENGGIQKLKPIEKGFYAMNGEITKEQQSNLYKKPYNGKVYLLVSPYNSSATYYLAAGAKRMHLATLVGQETGGNQKGINGGQIYFLNLPNSKIELDIPIAGVFPLDEQPDRGYLPDLMVTPKVENVMDGVDTELETVLKLIRGKRK